MTDDSDESWIEKSVHTVLEDGESPVGWYEVTDPQGVVLRSDVSHSSTWVTRLPAGTNVYIFGQRGHRVWVQKPVEGWTTIRMHSGHQTLRWISSIDPSMSQKRKSFSENSSRANSFIAKTDRNTLMNAQSRLSTIEYTASVSPIKTDIEISNLEPSNLEGTSSSKRDETDRTSVKIASIPEVKAYNEPKRNSFSSSQRIDERWKKDLYGSNRSSSVKKKKKTDNSSDDFPAIPKNSPFDLKLDDTETIVFDRNAIPAIAPSINFESGRFNQCDKGQTLWQRRMKIQKILFENCENTELSLADSVESIVSFSEQSFFVNDNWITFHEHEIPNQKEDEITKIECAYMGDNSTIYRVEEIETGMLQALKTIDISSAVMRQQIDTEISLLTDLHHKCLVKLFDVTWQPVARTICLLLEWCDGGSLYDYIKCTGPMHKKRIVKIAQCILNGLIYLHQKEILHNDIKPSNILLHKQGAKLSDFGISKPEHSTKTLLEHSGTHIYCAPERLLGESYDHTSDIWSFGLVIWAMAEGKSFFLPQCTIPKILSTIMKAGNIKLNKKHPKKLRKLFEACCKTTAAERKTAEELLNMKVFKKKKFKCVVS